ncbi:Per1-like protein [Coniophora puteana RWD-64-598 SS2]|uniref:Post-GPI attachment to proteins factor 3 n=1 Tax=Coniophora puteana (strain RWD-64-598) TaxID=741705 RepID=A0A5M3N432_CONPW|nr:Per1-like protein [Coniophora puteana RWD-64-598 SS2]EIW85615.1 Per1-like protein [Coniophora puteana RWD-64-598 SS2]
MRPLPTFLLSLTTLLSLSCLVYASAGDRDQRYQTCTTVCYGTRCLTNPPPTLPLSLRLTQWSCVDDCKYQCMHALTDEALTLGRDVLQYHGKWPFWRFLGAQEPASVAFSLLNLYFHVRGGLLVKRKVPRGHPMRRYYLAWAAVSANAWVWSAVFHTRDLPRTEKLDYFAAASAIMYALYYTVIRLFQLYSPSPSRPSSMPSATAPSSPNHRSLRIAWSLLCVGAYLAHITYLSVLPRFDYTYNMAFNLILGLLHNLLWALYSLPSSLTPSFLRRFPFAGKGYRPPYAGQAALFVLLTTVATSLELWDFPAWGRVIDAHALWHLSTAPIVKFWYEFLVRDALDEGWYSQAKDMKRCVSY